ncbi:hypothetical protein BM527_16470 [Alteromonas sp. Mex14]|nr:hypothetical protein BM527_16470 [Alteromonas sp. Mex14]
MKILVTGASGFTGRHFIELAEHRGHECIALSSGQNSDVGELQADVSDKDSLVTALRGVEIDAVVHLAAISFVAHGDIAEIYSTNTVGTANLIDVIQDNAIKPVHYLVASSGNIYGNANILPITEDTPFNPANDYAASKCAMEMALNARSNDCAITIARPFNYTGKGQAEHFLVPKIVKAFKSKQGEIELGNLDVARDFSDVRDVVNAYLKLLEAKVTGTFNICSGKAVPLSQVLQFTEALTGHKLNVRVNQSLVRSNEVKTLYGSDDKLQQAIGSYRHHNLENTLAWMLETK